MFLLATTIIAFGFGPGLNPPLDIHLPNKEEIYNEWERDQKRRDASLPKATRKERSKDKKREDSKK